MQAEPAETTPQPSRARRLLRVLARATVVLGVVGLVGGAIGWTWFDREILSTLPPDLGRDTDFRFPCSVQVYAADGTKVDSFHLEKRVWVPIGELPEHVWRAFVASEDRRFFEHRGVDPLGIARALVVNLRGGETKQGGSTITQQLVKNLLVGKERSYRRKLREAVLAYRLDDELDKMALLELYINYIALGSGNYGVEAAAQDYFGISARQLDVGQAALLAGLVPAPSRYSPRNHPEIAAQRRETVLKLMVAQGYATAAEASRHLADPVLVPRQSPDKGARAAYLTEVRREVRRLFGTEVAYLQGLQVRTPLDTRVQAVVEQAVRNGLGALEERQGARGPVRNVPDAGRAAFLARGDGLPRDRATGLPRTPVAGECFPALATGDAGALEAGPYRLALGAEALATRVRVRPGTPARPLGEVIARGDVLEVCAAGEGGVGADVPVVLRQRPWAESAAVVIENATGNVVALAGGYDVGLEGFVRATQAKRQPGSSFKPFVYAAALAGGLRQDSVVIDAPFAITGTNGLPWRPRNYDGGYKGPIALRNALALSLNTVAVRLAHTYGVDAVTRLARDLGVRTPLRSDLTVALGSSEVTPMDLAVGYASLARMGVRVDPVWITEVADRKGVRLGRAGEPLAVPGAPATAMPGGAGARALDAVTAYVTVDMMRNVVLQGTAKKAQRPGMDFAGKTGTTSGFVDAWFVGFSPRYTVAVWVGTDGTAPLGDKETGGKAALPTWIRIMEALPNVPGERFPVPPGVVLLPSGEQGKTPLWLGYRADALPEAFAAQAAALSPGDPRDVLPVFGGAPPRARAAEPAPGAGEPAVGTPDAAGAPLVVLDDLPDALDEALEGWGPEAFGESPDVPAGERVGTVLVEELPTAGGAAASLPATVEAAPPAKERVPAKKRRRGGKQKRRDRRR